MPAWMPSYLCQKSGRNHEIVLAEIKRIYTTPYCVIVMWYCSGDRTPSHSYVLVTGIFWECFQNLIYMHLHYIFFVFRIGGAICIISAWPIWLPEVHHFAIQLLPICCQYMYANFAFEIEGAICIIIAGPFDCQYFI